MEGKERGWRPTVAILSSALPPLCLRLPSMVGVSDELEFLFYFILFYFILFYFILFYLI